MNAANKLLGFIGDYGGLRLTCTMQHTSLANMGEAENGYYYLLGRGSVTALWSQ